MALYFLVHGGDWFEGTLRPALAASWRQRSFEPCRQLCHDLLPAVRVFGERFFTSAESTLVAAVANGLSFNRHLWRSLVGELLLYGAADVPEFQTSPETLCRLLALEIPTEDLRRESFACVHQLLYGTRDLVFGGGYYRPEKAGYNDRADLERLVAYLETIDPKAWTAVALQTQIDDWSDEECAEELEFVRETFSLLGELYRSAARRSQLIVCERIGD